MKAALYHRVSTLDQDAKLARDELRGWARRHKARVVLDVEEKGSGANNDRPGLQRVLEAARAGKLDVVVVYKLDRWGRSALDVLTNLRELVEVAGVRFVASSQSLDVRPGAGDAMSRLLLQVLASVAEFERDLIRDRTKIGLARARKRGAQIGRKPVPRPDVDVVREMMFARESEWGRRRPRVLELAKKLGCSKNVFYEVLELATCSAPRLSWEPKGRRCGRGGELCKRGCGATVCTWHRDEHVCRKSPDGPRGSSDKGTVSAKSSSARSRRPRPRVSVKGGAN